MNIKATTDYKCKETNGIFNIEVSNGCMVFIPEFYNKEKADYYFKYLTEIENTEEAEEIDIKTNSKELIKKVPFKNIKWDHHKINMFDKLVYLPRYSSWYGDKDSSYTYSGLALSPNEWEDNLLQIKNDIQAIESSIYNSVLLNWYRDGQDYISWHTDAEKSLGTNPTIASLSLGESRRFIIRRIDDHKQKLEIGLSHGSLLIMKGELQHFWQHSVPKQTKVQNSRINLTFRKIN